VAREEAKRLKREVDAGRDPLDKPDGRWGGRKVPRTAPASLLRKRSFRFRRALDVATDPANCPSWVNSWHKLRPPGRLHEELLYELSSWASTPA
jgi:hypothetical protein